MTIKKVWCTPCPACGYAEYGVNSSGASTSICKPLFEEQGSKCPECQAEIRMRVRGQGPTQYMEAEEV